MKSGNDRTKLKALASSDVAASSRRFFKTAPGQYGAGDEFIGVRVPDLRKLARECRGMPLEEIDDLLQSPVHEERLLALLTLVLRFNECNEQDRKEVYDLYFRKIEYVNNWDLVDSSAPAIVGGYLADKPRQPLVRLAKSESLWERRIAIIATQHFIRLDEYHDTLKISRILLADKEDLIHKATGWMLREVGKRDTETLIRFLDEHFVRMPRTMLRYAIEKLSPEIRRSYLKGDHPK